MAHLTGALLQPGRPFAERCPVGLILLVLGHGDSPEEAKEHKGCTVAQFLSAGTCARHREP